MDMRKAFPSNYLKAADVDEPTRARITGVKMADLGDGEKPVIEFEAENELPASAMALNKTNTNTLIAAYGWDSDDWVGKVVQIFATETNFQGRMVDALRLKAPKRQPEKEEPGPDDDIPW